MSGATVAISYNGISFSGLGVFSTGPQFFPRHKAAAPHVLDSAYSVGAIRAVGLVIGVAGREGGRDQPIRARGL